jgi:hypothetical protein
VLADAAARVPGFKPSKLEIEQMLKKVAGNPNRLPFISSSSVHDCM